MTWEQDEYGCWWLRGTRYAVWMAPRPPYCDRGQWLAHVEPLVVPHDLDSADGWPRYYFDLDRAKAEVEAWMQKRERPS